METSRDITCPNQIISSQTLPPSDTENPEVGEVIKKEVTNNQASLHSKVLQFSKNGTIPAMIV